MRTARIATCAAVLVNLMLVPAFAGQRGNSGNHGPTTHATPPSHPSPPANAGAKTTNGPSTHGAGSSKKDGTTATTSTTTTTTTLTPANFAATPVGQKLTRNTALQSNLATKLTALGYTGTVFEAAYGFKNLGQFVAAVNVSQNLTIPFDQLKLQMTGLTVNAAGNVVKTNTPIKSLGQSIQTLKPGADATEAAETETVEAETEIENTSHTSTTTTHSKSSKKKS